MFPVVTPEQIEEFAQQYKGSDEEKEDVLKAYTQGKGDMQFVMDNVMLAETDEDMQRFRAIIDQAIAEEKVPKFKKYMQKPRKQSAKRRNVRGKLVEEEERG